MRTRRAFKVKWKACFINFNGLSFAKNCLRLESASWCHNFPSAESFFVEIILRKKKWLIKCSYNPNKNNIKNHVGTISRTLDAFSTKYGNILLLRDFNACVDFETMNDFCSSYCLKNLIKPPTCFKNAENPSSIDLILTDKPRNFHSTCVIEIGLSDFHRMTVF